MELSGFRGGNEPMQDILWVAVTIAFFMLSIAYVHFCDRVK
jgi:cbb3-type cytochrome oxidase subunit 3